MGLRLVISSSTEAGTFCASSVSSVPAASRLFRDEPISPMGAGEGEEGWNEFGGDVEIYHNFCLIPRI